MLKWGTEDQHEIERRLKLAAPGFALVAQGCAKRAFGVPADFVGIEDAMLKAFSPELGKMSTKFGPYTELKSLAKAYSYKMLTNAKNGSIQELIADVRISQKLGHIADIGTSAIGRLVGIAIRAITYRSVEQCLALNPKLGVNILPPPRPRISPLEVCRIGIADGLPLFEFIRGLKQKDWESSAKDDKEIRELVDTGLQKDIICKAITAQNLTWYTSLSKELKSAANGGNLVKIAETKVAALKKSTDPTTFMWKETAEIMPGLLGAFLKDEAREQTLRGLIAVLNSKKIRRRFPNSLTECGFEGVDPFTGQPLGYVVKGGEVRVYSVGADLKDNAGLERRELVNREGEAIVAKYPRALPTK